MKRKVKTLQASTVISLLEPMGKLVDTYTHFSDTIMIWEFRSMGGMGPTLITIPPETRRRFKIYGSFDCVKNRYRLCIHVPHEEVPDKYQKEESIDA